MMFADKFVQGGLYSREAVANAVSFPAQKRTGGDFTTGYFEFDGSYFLFCNVGSAGRTGHDYPNQWRGNLLFWCGKAGSKLGQPRIARMVSGEAEVLAFWRAQDRAPFTFAGSAKAVEVADTVPVQVTWDFESTTPTSTRDTPVFRRGPVPSEGQWDIARSGGVTYLYLMVLAAPANLFRSDAGDGDVIIKVGISNAPERRLRELNQGFPFGSRIRWVIERLVPFNSAVAAFNAEGSVLEELRLKQRWIGGEFARIERSEVPTIFAALAPSHFEDGDAGD